jgi:hypothetical protein
MKALTVRQPWASLIVLGFKQIETRTRDTKHRGPLAIHAGLHLPCRRGERVTFGDFEVERDRGGLLLRSPLIPWPYRLPMGAVVGTVELDETRPTASTECKPDDMNRALGDFTPGRWAWSLSSPQRLPNIDAKGRLGLWDWTKP